MKRGETIRFGQDASVSLSVLGLVLLPGRKVILGECTAGLVQYTELTNRKHDPRAVVADPLIGPLLRTPWQAIRTRIVSELGAAGFGDIAAAHLAVLQHPTPDGVRPTELAARSQISKQAANRLIRHLEQRGYIALEPDPDDQRARIIRLTERGWDLIRAIQSIVMEVEAEWAAALGKKRFDELRRGLRELNQLLRS